jgi:PAS domain S-box-containing protein
MADKLDKPESRSNSSTRFDLEAIQGILPELIDSLSDAVLVVDREHRVVAANRRYAEAFGFKRARITGQPCCGAVNCIEVAAGLSAESCAACDAHSLKEPQRRLRVLTAADGSPRRWEATFSPVLDPTGEVSHIVVVCRDVSERSQLESQLSHSERLASLGILAAGVAHEINNPLASILAGVECLDRWIGHDGRIAVTPQEARDVVQVLERETRRCREITDKLLLLAQPYSVAPTWVDLNRAARDTISLLRYQMQKQGVAAVEDLDPELPEIWAKESAGRAICMNLMLNAIQAMPHGGTLTVRTRRSARGVQFEIDDTGPGIPASQIDRIWDPFFTTKPPGQGTGLGLSISQRIVSRHGGTVRAENRLEGGARFVVQLPVEGPGGVGV